MEIMQLIFLTHQAYFQRIAQVLIGPQRVEMKNVVHVYIGKKVMVPPFE